MKKLLLSISAVLSLLVLSPIATYADPAPQTAISGTISSGTSGVNSASVVVNCNGHTQNATTSNGGAYLAIFPIAQCPNGSSFTVSVNSNGKTGVGSGSVTKVSNKLNVNIGGDVALPEMGTVVGIAALAAAAVAFLVIRRKQQTASQIA